MDGWQRLSYKTVGTLRTGIAEGSSDITALSRRYRETEMLRRSQKKKWTPLFWSP